MEGVDPWGQLNTLIPYITNPESTIPVFRLVQFLLAVFGGIITAIGFYKSWRFAERRIGSRLDEFLDKERAKLKCVRQSIRHARGEAGSIYTDEGKIRTNGDLRFALNNIRRNSLFNIEEELTRAIKVTSIREELAREKLDLHEKQRAIAYILLGAQAEDKGRFHEALSYFERALEIDGKDVEALEYSGVQLMKLGDPSGALNHFKTLEQLAGDSDLLMNARSLRLQGQAYALPPLEQVGNSNTAYRKAIKAFPKSGPLLEIAFIHELRGDVNLKFNPPQITQAKKSYSSALSRYSQLMELKNEQEEEARVGVAQINKKLAKLTAQPTLQPN